MNSVPTLQQLLLRHVPTTDLLKRNLTHLLGERDRLVRDIRQCGVRPMPQWFMCLLLDTGNTCFFWFYTFVHDKIHRLALNQVMFVGQQEDYLRKQYSMTMFAMRVSRERVLIFVYANPDEEKNGLFYCRRPPKRILEQRTCSSWTLEDWEYFSLLEIECIFTLSTDYLVAPMTIHRYDDDF